MDHTPLGSWRTDSDPPSQSSAPGPSGVPEADTRQGRALRMLVAGACTVVLLAGFKAAGDVILPIVFSAFLSIATLPAVRWLQRKGVPSMIAIPLVVAVAAALLVGVTSIVAGSVRSFTRDVGQYEVALDALTAEVAQYAGRIGIDLSDPELSDLLTPTAVMGLVSQTLNSVVRLLGRTLIVVITLTFILLEASEIEQKFRVAFGAGSEVGGPMSEVAEKVQRYLLIKSGVSLVTGVLAAVVCRVLGIDFWLLWGLLAFLLNYIPSIGSILAAIPPILLALVQLGVPEALGCMIAYIVINVSLGNVLEPRLLGQGLGLSPLVVFLSLIFWGWMWGPVGMLLCVPMTAMVQLVLGSSDETRWIAVFLGSPRVIRKQAGATVAPPPPRVAP
jgi:AI-2 transport protein TqsA